MVLSVFPHLLQPRRRAHYIDAAYGKSLNTIRLSVESGIDQIRLEQE
jgi:hypothetical protein